MKAALILAALFAAFAFAGRSDYDVAAAMMAEHTPRHVASLAGGDHAR